MKYAVHTPAQAERDKIGSKLAFSKTEINCPVCNTFMKLPEIHTVTGYGFDPENLTFNGVKIKRLDSIKIKGFDELFEVVERSNCLYIELEPAQYIRLESMNVTAHHPKKNELEEAEEEMNKAKEELELLIRIRPSSLDEVHNDKIQRIIDGYYTARKHYEELKEQNL